MIIDDKALAEKIGAVLIEARRYSSFVDDVGSEFHKVAEAHCRAASLMCNKETTADRVDAIYEETRSAFRTVAFEVRCFESYRQIWASDLNSRTPDEISHLTHYFGHRCPLSLSTFSDYLSSIEFKCAFPRYGRALKLFDDYFPKAKEARNAVAHESERNLRKSSSYMRSGKGPILFDAKHNPTGISNSGYIYVDQNGNEFELQIGTEKLVSFWKSYVEFVRSECV